MTRERLTVKKLYDKIDELTVLLSNSTVPETGIKWWDAIAGFILGAAVGFWLTKVL